MGGDALGPDDVALVGVDADQGAVRAVGGGGLQEQALAPDDRRRVALAGNANLPADVFLVAPLDGDVFVGGGSGAVGSTEPRPLGGAGGEAKTQQDAANQQQARSVHGGGSLVTQWQGYGQVASGCYPIMLDGGGLQCIFRILDAAERRHGVDCSPVSAPFTDRLII